MNITKHLEPLAILFLLACQPSVPDGFTREGWDRYQRTHPDGAQVVAWVHEDSSREALMRRFVAVYLRHGWDAEAARTMFYLGAEKAMLTGADLRGFMVMLYKSQVQDDERARQYLIQSGTPNQDRLKQAEGSLQIDQDALAALNQ